MKHSAQFSRVMEEDKEWIEICVLKNERICIKRAFKLSSNSTFSCFLWSYTSSCTMSEHFQLKWLWELPQLLMNFIQSKIVQLDLKVSPWTIDMLFNLILSCDRVTSSYY